MATIGDEASGGVAILAGELDHPHLAPMLLGNPLLARFRDPVEARRHHIKLLLVANGYADDLEIARLTGLHAGELLAQPYLFEEIAMPHRRALLGLYRRKFGDLCPTCIAGGGGEHEHRCPFALTGMVRVLLSAWLRGEIPLALWNGAIETDHAKPVLIWGDLDALLASQEPPWSRRALLLARNARAESRAQGESEAVQHLTYELHLLRQEVAAMRDEKALVPRRVLDAGDLLANCILVHEGMVLAEILRPFEVALGPNGEDSRRILTLTSKEVAALRWLYDVPVDGWNAVDYGWVQIARAGGLLRVDSEASRAKVARAEKLLSSG